MSPNILRLSCHEDPITLDPQKSGDKLSSAIIFLLFKGLTRLEADHTIQCDLAESFYALNNCQKYVFRLGEHVWSDNTPIRAQDFVYSWKRALSPDFPARAANFFDHIKNAAKAKRGEVSLDKVGVYAEDDRTLVVELEHPCSYFPELTAFCPFFPVSSQADDDNISSICSGAFQLQEWDRGKEILLRKNYLCSHLTQLDTINIKIIPNEKEAFTLFENDQLDWIGDPISPLPVAYLPALFSDRMIKPIGGSLSCWFNTLQTPFNNVELRKALSYAIPREKLIEKLLLPNTLLTRRLCPTTFQSKETPLLQECSALAVELFESAIHRLKIKQLKLTLTYEETDLFSRIAANLKTHWEEMFNIRVQLEPISFKELYQRLPLQQFQVGLLHSISQYSDNINFLERFESKNLARNFSGWENAEYQKVLKQYRKTVDADQRQVLSEKAEQILLDEMPIAPIYCEYYTYLQKPHVHNLSISPVGVVHFDRVALRRDADTLSNIALG